MLLAETPEASPEMLVILPRTPGHVIIVTVLDTSLDIVLRKSKKLIWWEKMRMWMSSRRKMNILRIWWTQRTVSRWMKII